jgi:hypothetical protein
MAREFSSGIHIACFLKLGMLIIYSFEINKYCKEHLAGFPTSNINGSFHFAGIVLSLVINK